MFHGKIAIVTGGAQGIGKCIAEEFKKNGAVVCVIDKKPNDYFTGDLAEEETLKRFAKQVIKDHGRVDYLINNAIPLMKGISECSYEEFNYALRVGVTAPFYLTKLFLPYFSTGAAIVNISSSRDRMSQPQTESYTAAKGGIAALTHALAVSLAGKVRVNSISPGYPPFMPGLLVAFHGRQRISISLFPHHRAIDGWLRSRTTLSSASARTSARKGSSLGRFEQANMKSCHTRMPQESHSA